MKVTVGDKIYLYSCINNEVKVELVTVHSIFTKRNGQQKMILERDDKIYHHLTNISTQEGRVYNKRLWYQERNDKDAIMEVIEFEQDKIKTFKKRIEESYNNIEILKQQKVQ